MPSLFAMARLDYLTVKPYITVKKLLIIGAITFMLQLSTGNSAAAVGIVMIPCMQYISYPFSLAERDGLDTLYATLSLQRHIVVWGRYLFAFLLNLCSGAITFGLVAGLSALLQKSVNFTEMFLTTVIILGFYSVIQAIQLPMYFKSGYAKAKFAVYLPLAGLPAIIMVFSKFLDTSAIRDLLSGLLVWIQTERLAAACLAGLLWLALMGVSGCISIAFYRKRDL